MKTFPHLLLVDDNDKLRTHVKRFIQHLYPTVTISEASNGQEALKQYMRSGADIIVTDDVMPVLDGAAFIAELRMRSSTVPFVMISGDPAVEAQIALDGSVRCIPKRKVFKELAAVLRQFVGTEAIGSGTS